MGLNLLSGHQWSVRLKVHPFHPYLSWTSSFLQSQLDLLEQLPVENTNKMPRNSDQLTRRAFTPATIRTCLLAENPVVAHEMFWQPCGISTYLQDARQTKPTLLNSDCSTSCAFFEARFLSSSSLRNLSNLETSNKPDGLERNAPNNHHELHVSLHLHMHYQLQGRNERLG